MSNQNPEIDEFLEGFIPGELAEEPEAEETDLDAKEPELETKEPEETPEEETLPVEGKEDSGEDPEADPEVSTEPVKATEESDATEPEATDDELTLLRKRAELLEQRLNEAYSKVPQQSEEYPPKTTEAPDFFGDWNYEEIIDNEQSFKKFLGEFAEKVKGYTEQSLSQRLPQEVSRITNTQLTVAQRAERFFDEHKALAKVRPYVATITGQVAKENPKWDMEQVLQETAKRAYDALGLSPNIVEELQQEANVQPKKKPAFAAPKGQGNRGKAEEPQLSEMEKDILDLIEL